MYVCVCVAYLIRVEVIHSVGIIIIPVTCDIIMYVCPYLSSP